MRYFAFRIRRAASLWALAAVALGLCPGRLSAQAIVPPLAPADGNFCRLELGGPDDMDGKNPAHLNAGQWGETGADGDVKYRLLKPGDASAAWVIPAFDFDPASYGAINH